MRVSKIKFSDIEKYNNFLNILLEERTINSIRYSDIFSKITNGEYAEEDMSAFAITLDEIKQTLREVEEEHNDIDIQIKEILEKRNFEIKKRNKTLNLYNNEAHIIKYKTNKVETKTISVGSTVLRKVVNKIKIKVDTDKDRFYFVLVFDDKSILTKYVMLDNFIEAVQLVKQ